MHMLVLMTLLQGHSGSIQAINQRCMLSESKQAIRIKLATTVGLFVNLTLTLTLQTKTRAFSYIPEKVEESTLNAGKSINYEPRTPCVNVHV